MTIPGSATGANPQNGATGALAAENQSNAPEPPAARPRSTWPASRHTR